MTSVVPSDIQFDNGREFDNALVRDFVQTMTGSPPTYILPKHPQTNGQLIFLIIVLTNIFIGMVEQAHFIVYRRIMAIQEELHLQSNQWANILLYVAFLMNNENTRGTQMPPAQVLYNMDNPPALHYLIDNNFQMNSYEFLCASWDYSMNNQISGKNNII